MNFEGESKDVGKLGFLYKVTDISHVASIYKKKLLHSPSVHAKG